MTGGEVFVLRNNERFLNTEYVTPVSLSTLAEERLRDILEDYLEATESSSAKILLANWESVRQDFLWLLPKKVAVQMLGETQNASGAAA
jgi:glutamate synthase domain-containing protein 3